MAQETALLGRVIPAWRLALIRVEACWALQRQHWIYFFSGLSYSWLLLFSLGLGFGLQVKPSAATENMSYLNYIIPFLLLANAVETAAGESAFPILSGFRDKKDYWTVTLTPLTPGSLLAGQIIWVSVKILLDLLLFTLLCFALGFMTNPLIILIIPVALLTGLSIGIPIMTMAATTYHNDARLTVSLKLAIFPMAFFSGTFFSVNYIPDFLRFLPWISPLWHGNEIVRGIFFQRVSLVSMMAHAIFLIALSVLGTFISRKYFYRRLVA